MHQFDTTQVMVSNQCTHIHVPANLSKAKSHGYGEVRLYKRDIMFDRRTTEEWHTRCEVSLG